MSPTKITTRTGTTATRDDLPEIARTLSDREADEARAEWRATHWLPELPAPDTFNAGALAANRLLPGDVREVLQRAADRQEAAAQARSDLISFETAHPLWYLTRLDAERIGSAVIAGDDDGNSSALADRAAAQRRALHTAATEAQHVANAALAAARLVVAAGEPLAVAHAEAERVVGEHLAALDDLARQADEHARALADVLRDRARLASALGFELPRDLPRFPQTAPMRATAVGVAANVNDYLDALTRAGQP